MLGGCILKHHFVGSTCFKPDGFWGTAKNVEGDTLVLPVDTPATLDAFRRDFRLKRQSGQHGLSVVVPWLEMGDDGKEVRAFKRNTLVLAVLEGYFVPIIEDRLEVVVEDPSGSVRISKETYREALSVLQAVGDEFQIGRIQALIALAESARAGETKVFDLRACPPQKAQWTDDMLPPAMADEMRALLGDGAPVRVNASLTVRPKGSPDVGDRFACYIQKQQLLNHRPCHIREDIIVPNVDCARTAGYACIVRIDDGPLAALLGDSEGPAHTEWQPSSRNFKEAARLRRVGD